MKKYKLVIFSMILVMLFVTGCEEESTAPPAYSNGLMITLAQNIINNEYSIDASKEYNAKYYVSCEKNLNNVVKFTARNSDDEIWNVEFLWGPNAQNGDIVYISDSYYNTITLTSTEIGNYFINSTHPNAGDTYIKVIKYVDGAEIEAEIEGYIYETGGGTPQDSLKEGYFITTNFN
ncbi:MAG: hypothetical protein GQ534_02340 [Candidatus Delongbacteria bacterium]|nr:hypothetical protein [Candidatus Delongbacteria bacterium]